MCEGPQIYDKIYLQFIDQDNMDYTTMYGGLELQRAIGTDNRLYIINGRRPSSINNVGVKCCFTQQ